MYREAVSSEYFDVLGIAVVSGRGFTPAERTADAGIVVVSETLARQLWPTGVGVGQQVRLDAPQPASPDAPSVSSAEARGAKVEPSRTFTVVGVVRDPGSASGSSPDTFRRVTCRRVSRARSPGCCECAATRSRCGRRCWSASRLSIRPDNVISLQALARTADVPAAGWPSGSRSYWEDSRSC